MCRLFGLHRSGFYAWLKKPLSDITIEENRLLKLIKAFYLASGGIYGSSWIHRDLRDAGEQCSVNRVGKIMSVNKLQAQIGYERRILKADSILQSFLRQLCNLKRSLESRVSSKIKRQACFTTEITEALRYTKEGRQQCIFFLGERCSFSVSSVVVIILLLRKKAVSNLTLSPLN
jgi:hypothetical protein